MKTKQILFAFISIVLFSCEKEDEVKQSETEQKLIGSWNRTKIESRKPNEEWQDITKNCDKDDVEEFQSSGKYVLYPGTALCNDQDGLLSTGTWRTASNDTKIIFTYDEYEGEYESSIESISSTTLVLKHATGLEDQSEIRKTYTKTR